MNKENNNIKLNFKNAIFNKFYLEFLVFFIILFVSTILNLIIDLKIRIESIKILISFIIMIITILSLYSFGYIIAQKRKLLNKYFPSVFFAIIFLIIWILAIILKDGNSFVAKLVCDSDKIILMIHKCIFNLINVIFNITIPSRLFSFFTPLIVYLGNAKSRRRELIRLKKERMTITKEESNGYGNI